MMIALKVVVKVNVTVGGGKRVRIVTRIRSSFREDMPGHVRH